MEALGYPAERIRQAKAAGAKLVGCGQAGKLIAAQWIYLDCIKSDGGEYGYADIKGVATVCYKKFVGTPPPESEDPAIEHDRVSGLFA